jgi:hypothetical protein
MNIVATGLIVFVIGLVGYSDRRNGAWSSPRTSSPG